MEGLFLAFAMFSGNLDCNTYPKEYWDMMAISLIQSDQMPRVLSVDNRELLSKAIKSYCVDEEIMDAREWNYTLIRMNYSYTSPDGISSTSSEQDQVNWEADLRSLQKRYKDLLGAPKIIDTFRFPARQWINEQMEFNRKFRDYLHQQLQTSPPSLERLLGESIRDNERCWQVWDSVRDAQCDFYYITVRRFAMKSLIQKIGRERFYTNDFGPTFATWRFREIE